MVLDRINLINFRSYKEKKFKLGPGVNLVVGPNASGKTNFLESLYVMASTKSFRGKDYDLINHDTNFYRVVAGIGEDELIITYLQDAEKREKRVTHNGVRKTLSDHIGQLQAVLFEPGDLEMVSGPPETRRKYLDFMLCQTDNKYLQALSGYKRVLKQRNALLSNFDTSRIKAEILVWDIKLTELATVIVERRQNLLRFLNPRAEEIYSQIASDTAQIELKYKPSIEINDDYAGSFMTGLANRLTNDLAAGFTTIGPHREDFTIEFRGRSITAVASRGETRTSVLALKLAELDYCEQASGKRPILLLDDVFSELDGRRRHDLMRRLEGYQTIITATEADTVMAQMLSKYELIRTDSNNA